MLLLENRIISPIEFVEHTGCNADELEQYCYLGKGTLNTEDNSNVITLKPRRWG